MRVVQKLGAGISLAGLLLVMAGGMHVRGGPDGTWVQVNIIHAIGGVALCCGCAFSVVAASMRGGAKAGPESAS